MKAITAFSFSSPAATGVIDETAKTISISVPYGTDITTLVADFSISEFANAKVGITDQVSSTTSNDYTNPVSYLITAEDGTFVTYVVSVTVLTGISNSYSTVLEIYPNPVKSTIILKNISATDINYITITNMNGQIVKHIKSYNDGFINVEELGAGVYNLSVTKKDNTLSNLRFVKQ
jgi:hypothetical protein